MSDRMRLRVTGGLNPKTWSVVDVATGRHLPCTKIAVDFDIDSLPRLAVEVLDFEADIEGEARVLKLCPGCRGEVEADDPPGPGADA